MFYAINNENYFMLQSSHKLQLFKKVIETKSNQIPIFFPIRPFETKNMKFFLATVTLVLSTMNVHATGTTCKNIIEGFTLIDATLDTDVRRLGTYDIKTVPARLNIRANPLDCGDDEPVVQSVSIQIDSETARCERKSPFAAFGNDGADYYGGDITLGSHTISAVPYTGDSCTGTAGAAVTQDFDVYNCGDGIQQSPEECDDGNQLNGDGCSKRCKVDTCHNEITGFTLIDADDDSEIGPLEDYALADVPMNVNIRAEPHWCNTIPTTASVLIKTDRTTRCERMEPYAAFGNSGDDYHGRKLVAGKHTVRATPYTGDNCDGVAGRDKVRTIIVS